MGHPRLQLLVSCQCPYNLAYNLQIPHSPSNCALPLCDRSFANHVVWYRARYLPGRDLRICRSGLDKRRLPAFEAVPAVPAVIRRLALQLKQAKTTCQRSLREQTPYATCDLSVSQHPSTDATMKSRRGRGGHNALESCSVSVQVQGQRPCSGAQRRRLAVPGAIHRPTS